MGFHNFHDGDFDGIRLEPNKSATIFLRSAAKRSYTMVLKGVERIWLRDFKEGNIILDLVCRSARKATLEDVQLLYEVDVNVNAEMASKVLNNLRSGEKELQILELNPSYGAEGLFLFESIELSEIVP